MALSPSHFSIFSPGGLTSFSCFLCRARTRTHRLPMPADAARPASCPRAFRQRWMLINAVRGGGNASGLYVSPSYHFFCLLNLNLYVRDFIAPLPSHFVWMDCRRGNGSAPCLLMGVWFMAFGKHLTHMTFQGWIWCYCHLVCRGSKHLVHLKKIYKRLLSLCKKELQSNKDAAADKWRFWRHLNLHSFISKINFYLWVIIKVTLWVLLLPR